MALNEITFTILLEDTSTVDSTDAIIVSTEEKARTFSIVKPEGYESHTCNVRLLNSEGTTYLLADVGDSFQLNGDVLSAGRLDLQFELVEGTSRYVDNTIFSLFVEEAIADASGTTSGQFIVYVQAHVDDLSIHFEDAPSDGTSYVRKDGEWASLGSVSVSWGGIGGTLSDQTDLQSELDGKADSTHTHTETDITDLDKYTQSETDTLLLTKADSSHTHTESDITDLGTYLTDAPIDGTQYARQDGSWTTVTSSTTAWGDITGTLSSQTDLQSALDGKASSTHTHVEADITDLGSYLTDAPSDGSQYARQDGAWEVVSVANTDTVTDQNTSTGVGNIKFWTGTQAEYDLLTPASDTVYFIK